MTGESVPCSYIGGFDSTAKLWKRDERCTTDGAEISFGPDVVGWKGKSVKELVYTGLFQSVGFYIISGGFMFLLNCKYNPPYLVIGPFASSMGRTEC